MKELKPDAKFETSVCTQDILRATESPRIPIVQSTTYCFDSTDHIAALFDMPTEYMYSRFANPTCDAVEKRSRP